MNDEMSMAYHQLSEKGDQIGAGIVYTLDRISCDLAIERDWDDVSNGLFSIRAMMPPTELADELQSKYGLRTSVMHVQELGYDFSDYGPGDMRDVIRAIAGHVKENYPGGDGDETLVAWMLLLQGVVAHAEVPAGATDEERETIRQKLFEDAQGHVEFGEGRRARMFMVVDRAGFVYLLHWYKDTGPGEFILDDGEDKTRHMFGDLSDALRALMDATPTLTVPS